MFSTSFRILEFYENKNDNNSFFPFSCIEFVTESFRFEYSRDIELVYALNRKWGKTGVNDYP